MYESLYESLSRLFTNTISFCISDESPRTCSAFLESDGLKLFKRILNETRISESVLTKILGLLNNIAEVPDLRSALMDDDIIASVRYNIEIDFLLLSLYKNYIILITHTNIEI